MYSAVAYVPSWAGPQELVLLFALVLVLFGPRKLPEIARALGRLVSELRRTAADCKDQFMHMDEALQPPDNVDDVVDNLDAGEEAQGAPDKKPLPVPRPGDDDGVA